MGNFQMCYIVQEFGASKNIQRNNAKDMQEILLKQVDCIIDQYIVGDEEMIQFGKKLKTARDSLFTFVIHCDVSSTNNDTENSI